MTEPIKYRKKPIKIEALQWDGSAESATPIIDWALPLGATIKYHEHLMDGDFIAHPDPFLWVDMPGKRRLIASAGDYIVRGVEGEFYPCPPSIFEKTYDRIVERCHPSQGGSK
jgi:hypothetical protein